MPSVVALANWRGGACTDGALLLFRGHLGVASLHQGTSAWQAYTIGELVGAIGTNQTTHKTHTTLMALMLNTYGSDCNY